MVDGPPGLLGHTVVLRVQQEQEKDREPVTILFLSMVEICVMEIQLKRKTATHRNAPSVDDGQLGPTGLIVQGHAPAGLK